ncbi:alpha-mannosidase [Clostridium perfringens]|nr:alpha-mannosidase [Clostridium perfringens]
MKKKVYVVPHSHWDREWYFTIEDSNVLLSQNIPYLMDVLEKEEKFKSYTFDAQASVIEEFLKLYPDEEERLKKLVKDKRIFIGPWYTQTDSLLVNKESIIRNLLYGTRICNEMGHSMKVGYLPDIFGQNSYLPSIFTGFDIEDSVLQRGVYTEQLNSNLNFTWTSPDNKKVRANNIFLGYGPGKFLSDDDDYINKKLIPMLEKLESLNKDTDNLLLPSGGDQVLIRSEFPKIIEELNKKQNRYEFILSDYETFMKDTWKENDFENKINGELIGCEKSRIHNTIKSQRYDLKKLNTEVENKILYILEPLGIIGKSLGLKYPSPWIDIMWKELFDAHAHDSIGGCNSDDTNKNILNRLIKCNNICDDLINIIKKQITKALSKKLDEENIVTIINTNVKEAFGPFECVIFTKNKEFKIEDLIGNEIEIDVLKSEIISGGKQVAVTAEGEVEIELPGYYRSEILIYNESIVSMGYKAFKIKETDENEEVENLNKVEENKESFIENELYKIEVKNNLKLINNKTGEIIEDFLYFEECGDEGDSYDFSPVHGEKIKKINFFEVLECKRTRNTSYLKILHKGMIPKNLEERKNNEDSLRMEIETKIELRNNEEFIRINHSIDNKACDHRVRAVLNSNIKSNYSLADQGFSMIKRINENKYLKSWKENKFAEAPVALYAIENFLLIEDEKNILGAITKGIKEYEILDNNKIALTLFRSVGLLGKDNLEWRPGRASGINNKVVHTKDAQLIGKLDFEYAVYFDENREINKLFDLKEKFIKHYTTYQNQSLNLFEERLERFSIPLNLEINKEENSLLGIDNKNIYISVCKEAYEKDGLILRLFNPSENIEKVKLSGEKISKIIFANLYERELGEVDHIEIVPKGYVTVKIKF